MLKKRKFLIWAVTSNYNEFRNQRSRISKNSYVAKNQTKLPGGITVLASCAHDDHSLFLPFSAPRAEPNPKATRYVMSQAALKAKRSM